MCTRKMRPAIIACICLIMIAAQAYTASDPLEAYRRQRGVIAPIAVDLARQAVESYITIDKAKVVHGKLPDLFRKKAAVFVTISKNGQRRGCKGAFEPVTGSLRDEIIRTAVQAATADIRYRPIRRSELKDVTFVVSIVGPLRRVRDSAAYSPRQFGLLIKSGDKSGVVLPGEAKTSQWRLSEARKQAGVGSKDPCEMYVFEAVELREQSTRASSSREG